MEINPQNRGLDKIDFSLARRAISKLLGDKDNFDVTKAGELFLGINMLEGELLGLTASETESGIAVVKQVLARGKVNEDDANQTLTLLSRQQQIQTQRSGRRPSLDTPIEYIKELAMKQMSQVLEAEVGVGETEDLSPLERAALNLTTINGWVDEGTWLNIYLHRTDTRINIYSPWWQPIKFTGNMMLGAFQEVLLKQNVLNTYEKTFNDKYFLTHNGLTEYTTQFNLSDLQKEWDINERRHVRAIADIAPNKAALTVLGTVQKEQMIRNKSFI